MGLAEMRLGLAFPGNPFDPAAWSGTPAGLVRGFTEAGVHVVPIRAEFPSPLQLPTTTAIAAFQFPRLRGGSVRERLSLSRRMARNTIPVSGMLRSCAANGQLWRAGQMDAVVQVWTNYLIRTHFPVATYDDMTIIQAVESGYPQWGELSRRALATVIARQRRAYEQAVACCVTTNWVRRSLIEDYGVPPGKVHVVGIGRNHSSPPAFRNWASPRFLFVGNDWQRKNGEAVLRVFSRLRMEIPAATLDLVGGHPPIHAGGVWGHGRLPLSSLWARERLERLFQTATCLVVPSLHEPSALVYSEAAAAGIPSIGTRVGGSADIIGEAGRLVDPFDDDALLSAMLALADPDTASQLGALARERSTRFTWLAVAERILDALGLQSTECNGERRGACQRSGS
jgi:glycosyltransferase involved in cell wall biosynthesis